MSDTTGFIMMVMLVAITVGSLVASYNMAGDLNEAMLKLRACYGIQHYTLP